MQVMLVQHFRIMCVYFTIAYASWMFTVDEGTLLLMSPPWLTALERIPAAGLAL